MDLYAENILDHYRHPRHRTWDMGHGTCSSTVSHREENLSCGDELTLRLNVEDRKITALSWEGTGCAISQAAMSMLSEELIGMSIADAEKLSKNSVYAMLGVPIGPRRFKCALLGLHTLKNALRKEQGQTVQSWIETVGVDA